MWTDIFMNSCFDSRLANGFLQNTLVPVMAFHFSIIWIFREIARRKNELPGPFFGSIGILLRQGIGKGDFSVPGSKVALMKVFHRLELSLQGQLKPYWQHGCTIMHSFWVTHDHLVLFKVHIFYP